MAERKIEKYMEIGERYWKINTAIVNFCGFREAIEPPTKGIIMKGLCLGIMRYDEAIRRRLSNEYQKEFPGDEHNPFTKIGWKFYQ